MQQLFLGHSICNHALHRGTLHRRERTAATEPIEYELGRQELACCLTHELQIHLMHLYFQLDVLARVQIPECQVLELARGKLIASQHKLTGGRFLLLTHVQVQQ